VKLRVFRHLRPDHDPLSGAGALRYGGRWNPKGAFGALYASLTERSLRAEMERQLARSGVPRRSFFPRCVVEIEVEADRVLDLREAAERRRLGVTLEDMRADDLSKCQRVAARVREEGGQAILYPSAAGKGTHVVVFPDRLPSGALRVAGERRWDA
jgi:RES domain-containing protein